MVAIFIAFFPLSLGANYAARALVPDWSLVLRLLTSSLVMIPLMTYVVMPWITRLLAPWLNGAQSRP